jgi:hypothetical protein
MRPRSPSTAEPLSVTDRAACRSIVKCWTKAGILNSHKANGKNERLYEPPIAGDPRLTARQGQGSPLRKRVLT